MSSAAWAHGFLSRDPFITPQGNLSSGIIDIYAAPVVGATSYSLPSGGDNRDTQSSYGGEVVGIWREWGAALNVSTFSVPQAGTSDVNVGNRNILASAEGRYRFWNQNFSPYVSAGGGSLFQTVQTQVMGSTEKASSNYFLYHAGIGMLGAITQYWAFDLGIKYYRYSNVNGFNYFLSFGPLF